LSSDPLIVVFSDVDSVVTASEPAAFTAAARALKRLAGDNVALAFCSSRTRAELEHVWQGGLGVSHPLLSECGGALFLPHRYFPFDVPNARDIVGYRAVEFGRPYASVAAALHRVADRLQIAVRGFGDMSVEEVARESGMTLLQAHLAKLREYGELFHVVDPSSVTRNRLFKGLQAGGLHAVNVGTYDHVGAPAGLSLGIELLRSLYRHAHGALLSVGMVDVKSSGELLRFVDYPVFVHRGDVVEMPWRVQRSAAAPVAYMEDVAAWAAAIVSIVERLRRKPKASHFQSAAADAPRAAKRRVSE